MAAGMGAGVAAIFHAPLAQGATASWQSGTEVAKRITGVIESVLGSSY